MRYKAGWLIDKQVLALTHFEPVVTMQDFEGIVTITNRAIQRVNQTFHLLIDNRIIEDTSIASLNTILQAMPLLKHSSLQWIVMILPESIKHEAQDMAIQQQGTIQMRFVDNLDTAFAHLRSVDDSIFWHAIDTNFFSKPSSDKA